MSKSNDGKTRRHWGRWVGVGGVGLLLFGVAATPLVWSAIAGHRLNGELARLRAAGEPVSGADLPAETLPDPSNGSLDYKAAGPLIDVKRPAWARWDQCGQGEFVLPLTADERGTLHAIVADNGPALARVAAARGKGAGGWGDAFAPPYLFAVDRYDLGGERGLGNLLRLAAMSAHADGDDARAVDLTLDLCRLADAAEHRPTLIAHLVADGLWSLAASTATELAPDLRVGGPNGATGDPLDQLLARLADERAATAGRLLSWRCERITDVDSLRGIMTGRTFPTVGGPTVGGPTAGGSSVERYVVGPMALSDALLVSRYVGRLMAATNAPDLPAARRAYPTDLDAELDAHAYRHLFARILVPSLTRAAEADYRSATARRLAEVAVAVRRYAVAHEQQLPTALDELSSAFPKGMPMDPMSGRPLVYRPEGTDPKVYSVGLNGIDNGGLEEDPKLPRSRQRDRDDIVVHLTRRPRPATQP